MRQQQNVRKGYILILLIIVVTVVIWVLGYVVAFRLPRIREQATIDRSLSERLTHRTGAIVGPPTVIAVKKAPNPPNINVDQVYSEIKGQ